MFFAACLIRCSFSTKPTRTNPSPYSPNAIPGATATSAFNINSFANSNEPLFLYFYGKGAQAHILAWGLGIVHPDRAIDSINTSLLF